MRRAFLLLIPLLLLFSPACSKKPSASDDPANARIVIEDLERFWNAWDKAVAFEDAARRAEVFREFYLEPGSAGLQDFLESRISSAEKLVEAIDAHPAYYAQLRERTPDALHAAEPVREAFNRLEALYPEAVFPDVYILVGRLNSGGTVGKSGLLIGFDMHGRHQGAGMQELNDWLHGVVQPVEAMPNMIAHELVHYQQEWLSSMPPLLVQVFREGSADFIAELISGRHLNRKLHDWALPREAEIWEHFSARMHDTDTAGYLYGGSARPDGWPQDVGYFIGYRIAQAYYAQAGNKQQAVADILADADVEGLLAKSGYAKRFEKMAGHLTLSRLDEDSWRTQYCYPVEIEAIRFERPFPGLRENSWRVADDAFELEFDEGMAELRRRDRALFDCASVDLATWTVRPEKDYYAFSPFSDGGMSVYTGHLMGPVLVEGEWRETTMAARYLGREGEHVITREPQRLVHQFVYFGPQQALETDSLLAVIDPAMPARARADILDNVPAVNALLEQEFGFSPQSRYMLFMATETDAFDGHSVKGGAQAGQVLFTLKGRGIPALIEKYPAHFPKTTAHEVLHLWQGEHWNDTLGNDHPWVHEGSADALAFEIMRRTGGYDSKTYESTWAETEAECVKALAETSVHAAPAKGRFDAVYSCGAVVNRLVGESLNAADPGKGIIAFWREMAAWPVSERTGASEALFFRTLEKTGVNQSGRKALQAFLDLQTDNGEQALAELRAKLQAASTDTALPTWLAGCWERRDGDSRYQEHWMPPLAGSMYGVSRDVRNGVVQGFEFLRIVTGADSKVAYVALPSGQAETEFPLVASDHESIVFENPAHDFPKRITYRLQGEVLIAVAEAGARRFQLEMRAAPCSTRAAS